MIEEKLKTYRLTADEYSLMKQLLQREPRPIEWPLFSALWSEHCSYKSSKTHLRKFSFRNEMTPDMDGENAGVVDLGFGERIAFKMESHNHPSFIEPMQGAATGVGGILRDIFTMGARPIASANFLCFGELQADRMPELMRGVVRGISSYGNCVGVPTITGQTYLHARYNKNILVNALSVGYFAPDQKMALSKAAGIKNWVVYVGAKTGRDGVHGAAMASASFDEDAESKKPNVQIGDPFYEKLLIEACLEVLRLDLVVAMQDMGAAGLTSSSFEMAAKGNVGLEIDLKKVPLRDSSMTAEDILLSESQERMLLICKPENFSSLQKVFKHWSLDAVVLGEVIGTNKIHLKWGAETLTEIDPALIVDRAPRYDKTQRPYNEWSYPNRTNELIQLKELLAGKISNKISKDKFSAVDVLEQSLKKALQQQKLNSRRWIHNQYDQRVGARTAMSCENAAAFVRLDHSGRGLGLALGCRPEVMLMDARIGALDAVYYPALLLAVKGAVCLAVTDCLNFGNPQKVEIMSEFVASVEAIAKAGQELNAPVISGNVSFYNETLGENIISTPATGIVGLRPDVENILPDHLQNPHESLIHVRLNWVNSWSMFSIIQSSSKPSDFVQDDQVDAAYFIRRCASMDNEFQLRDLKVSAIKVVGLGGLAFTCLKMATTKVGFDLSYEAADFTDDNRLANEWLQDQFYGFVLSTARPNETIDFLRQHFSNDLLKGTAVEVRKIGETTNTELRFTRDYAVDSDWFFKQFESGL